LDVNKLANLSEKDIDRVIEMAWEDRTPFDAILAQFSLSEDDVKALMKREMKPSSWRMWRARVQGRKTKHAAIRVDDVDRFKCTRQRQVSNNKISKRSNSR
jgi:uncharacterized protein (TIGR03643 family)